MKQLCWQGLALIGCLSITAGAVKRPSSRVRHVGDNSYHPAFSFLETHEVLNDEVMDQIHSALSGVSRSTRHFDRYLASLEDALVSLMRQKDDSPYLSDAINNILHVANVTLKKGIIDQHAAAQQAVANADGEVLKCHGSLKKALNASDSLRDELLAKSNATRNCYNSETASSEMTTALLSLPRLLNAKTSDCKNFLMASDVNEAPFEAWALKCDHHDDPSVGTYLMKQLMHWEALLEQYDAIEHRCKHSIELYSAQVSRYTALKGRQKHGVGECRALQDDLDSSACKQAMGRIESCAGYQDCIKESIGHRAAAHETICKGEDGLKDQWYAISTVECFFNAYRDTENLKDLKASLDTCKSLPKSHYDVSRFEVRGCHSTEAALFEALDSTKPNSTSSMACAAVKVEVLPDDPFLPGTDAYEATYYNGFSAQRCNATCCLNPPFPTTTTSTTTTTTSTSTTTTTTTTTTTICTDVKKGCLQDVESCNNTGSGRVLAVRSLPQCQDGVLEFQSHEQTDCDYTAEKLRILLNKGRNQTCFDVPIDKVEMRHVYVDDVWVPTVRVYPNRFSLGLNCAGLAQSLKAEWLEKQSDSDLQVRVQPGCVPLNPKPSQCANGQLTLTSKLTPTCDNGAYPLEIGLNSTDASQNDCEINGTLKVSLGTCLASTFKKLKVLSNGTHFGAARLYPVNSPTLLPCEEMIDVVKGLVSIYGTDMVVSDSCYLPPAPSTPAHIAPAAPARIAPIVELPMCKGSSMAVRATSTAACYNNRSFLQFNINSSSIEKNCQMAGSLRVTAEGSCVPMQISKVQMASSTLRLFPDPTNSSKLTCASIEALFEMFLEPTGGKLEIQETCVAPKVATTTTTTVALAPCSLIAKDYSLVVTADATCGGSSTTKDSTGSSMSFRIKNDSVTHLADWAARLNCFIEQETPLRMFDDEFCYPFPARRVELSRTRDGGAQVTALFDEARCFGDSGFAAWFNAYFRPPLTSEDKEVGIAADCPKLAQTTTTTTRPSPVVSLQTCPLEDLHLVLESDAHCESDMRFKVKYRGLWEGSCELLGTLRLFSQDQCHPSIFKKIQLEHDSDHVVLRADGPLSLSSCPLFNALFRKPAPIYIGHACPPRVTTISDLGEVSPQTDLPPCAGHVHMQVKTVATCPGDSSFMRFAVTSNVVDCEMDMPGLRLSRNGQCLFAHFRRARIVSKGYRVAEVYGSGTHSCSGSEGFATMFNLLFRPPLVADGVQVTLQHGCLESSLPTPIRALAPGTCTNSDVPLRLILQSPIECSEDGSYQFRISAGIGPTDSVDLSTQECSIEGPDLMIYDEKEQSNCNGMSFQKIHFRPEGMSISGVAFPAPGALCNSAEGQKPDAKYTLGHEILVGRCRDVPQCSETVMTSKFIVQSEATCSRDQSYMEFQLDGPVEKECTLPSGLRMVYGRDICMPGDIHKVVLVPGDTRTVARVHFGGDMPNMVPCAGIEGHAAAFNELFRKNPDAESLSFGGCPAAPRALAGRAPVCPMSAEGIAMIVTSEATCTDDNMSFRVDAAGLPNADCALDQGVLNNQRLCWDDLQAKKIHFQLMDGSFVVQLTTEASACSGPGGYKSIFSALFPPGSELRIHHACPLEPCTSLPDEWTLRSKAWCSGGSETEDGVVQKLHFQVDSSAVDVVGCALPATYQRMLYGDVCLPWVVDKVRIISGKQTDSVSLSIADASMNCSGIESVINQFGATQEPPKISFKTACPARPQAKVEKTENAIVLPPKKSNHSHHCPTAVEGLEMVVTDNATASCGKDLSLRLPIASISNRHLGCILAGHLKVSIDDRCIPIPVAKVQYLSDGHAVVAEIFPDYNKTALNCHMLAHQLTSIIDLYGNGLQIASGCSMAITAKTELVHVTTTTTTVAPPVPCNALKSMDMDISEDAVCKGNSMVFQVPKKALKLADWCQSPGLNCFFKVDNMTMSSEGYCQAIAGLRITSDPEAEDADIATVIADFPNSQACSSDAFGQTVRFQTGCPPSAV
ncbi:Putative small nuclear ribonucleoprotein E, partial [Durusdinium trenchii]